MRILHLYSGNLYGGIETLLATLARQRGLCREMEPHFALCFEGRLSRELTSCGARVHLLGTVRASRPATVLRARRRVRDLLERGDFDLAVCHAGWSQAIFAPAARAARVPLVFWMHDAAQGRHWIERWARLSPPQLAICNSRYTAGTLRTIYPGIPAEIVHYPVAPLPEYPLEERLAVRAELETPGDATVIIQVSRMERWKGHLLHLEALGRLRDLPGWICWQVGGAQRALEVEYLRELRRTSARLGIADRVRFLGERSDVGRLLGAADVHCQPNTAPEPFGITFVEGLLARLPVVTTVRGAAAEIVDESCGMLVPPDRADALADALRCLVSDPGLRRRLGEAGPERARRLSDPAGQLEKLHAVLERAAHTAAAA